MNIQKLMLIAIFYFCPVRFVGGQQIEFYKHFSSNYELAFSSICKVHDGGLIVVGEAFAQNGSNFFYMKTDVVLQSEELTMEVVYFLLAS